MKNPRFYRGVPFYFSATAEDLLNRKIVRNIVSLKIGRFSGFVLDSLHKIQFEKQKATENS